MAQNKINITSENAAEWLASFGFIFPTTETEMIRFRKLHGDIDPTITGLEVDPKRIISGNKSTAAPVKSIRKAPREAEQYKMVARNMNKLPQHILDKMKQNQQSSKPDDNNSEKKND